MSNSTRIWIAYALMALPFMLVASGLASPALGYLERTNPDLAPKIAFGVFIAWGIGVFMIQAWARCWRCGESVFRLGERLFGPIVLRTRCVKCGVKHAARPEAAS